MRPSLALFLLAIAAALGVVVVLLVLRGMEERGRGGASLETGASAVGPVEQEVGLAVLPPVPEAGPERTLVEPSLGADGHGDGTSEEKPGTIRLVVNDPAGRPLAGARVQTFADSIPGEYRTAADGACTIRVRPSRSSVRLLVEHAGHAHARKDFPVRSQLVVLSPATELTGRVLDAATGVPVPRATISRWHISCKGCRPDGAIADANGRYRLSGLPRDTGGEALVFAIWAQGYPTQENRFGIRAGEGPQQHDFELQRGVPLSGEVVDFTTGAPVTGAIVRSGAATLPCDQRGRFAGLVLPGPKPIEISASAPGYCKLVGRIPSAELATPLRLRVPRGAVIQGSVRDAAGAPIADASIWVGPGQRGPGPLDDLAGIWGLDHQSRWARSDEKGRYRGEGIVPWTLDLRVQVARDGYREASLSVAGVGGPGSVTRMEVVLEPEASGATIEGELTLNGRPARGSVAWAGPSGSGSSRPVWGWYRLTGLESGSVTLKASLKGHGSVPFPDAEVVVQVAAGAGLVHDFHLEALPSTISGHLWFEDGGPAEGIQVLASPTQGLSAKAISGQDGVYVLHVLDVGVPFTVSACCASEVRRVEDVRPGTAGLDLVLPRPGVLLYRILERETGDAVSHFDLCWRRSTEESYHELASGVRRTVDSDLWHEASLPAGPIDLFVSAGRGGYQPARLEHVLVRSDVPTRVDLRLERGFTVPLQFDPSCGRPPKGYLLVLLEVEADDLVRCQGAPLPRWVHEERKVRYNAAGAAKLKGLGPGRYRFRTCPDDLVVMPAELELAFEPTEPIVVAWRRR